MCIKYFVLLEKNEWKREMLYFVIMTSSKEIGMIIHTQNKQTLVPLSDYELYSESVQRSAMMMSPLRL